MYQVVAAYILLFKLHLAGLSQVNEKCYALYEMHLESKLHVLAMSEVSMPKLYHRTTQKSLFFAVPRMSLILPQLVQGEVCVKQSLSFKLFAVCGDSGFVCMCIYSLSLSPRK
jgi:hypothetical protein